MRRGAKAEYAVRLASCAMYTRGLFASYYDRYLNGSETQKARYTEIWTYFRDLAVDTQYYFAGGYGASVGELKLSDFNIEENPGEVLARRPTRRASSANGGSGGRNDLRRFT